MSASVYPSAKQAPPKRIAVPAGKKLSELSHAQLVALRDALRGQPKGVADKAYRRAVRKFERATRSGAKRTAPKPAAKKASPKAKAPTKEEHLKRAA
jgi:hypothetical protein